MKQRVGEEHHPAVDAIAGLEFNDLDKSIKDDVSFLKNHPLILKETVVTGYKYHVRSSSWSRPFLRRR